jgi:hypothetical protein
MTGKGIPRSWFNLVFGFLLGANITMLAIFVLVLLQNDYILTLFNQSGGGEWGGLGCKVLGFGLFFVAIGGYMQ